MKKIVKKIVEFKTTTNGTIVFTIELKEMQNGINFETLENIDNYYSLSICGTPRKNGCSCQRIEEISKKINVIKKSELKKFLTILNIWKQYHLNDLQAGTKTQTEALKTANIKEWAINYKKCCDYLENINLLNDKGYKFGTGWLVKEIPTEIIDYIKAL